MENTKEKLYVGQASEMLGFTKWIIKILVSVLILTIILLAGTNMAWLYVFQSYDYVTEEIIQDGNNHNIINTGTQGDIMNGTELQESK